MFETYIFEQFSGVNQEGAIEVDTTGKNIQALINYRKADTGM